MLAACFGLSPLLLLTGCENKASESQKGGSPAATEKVDPASPEDPKQETADQQQAEAQTPFELKALLNDLADSKGKYPHSLPRGLTFTECNHQLCFQYQGQDYPLETRATEVEGSESQRGSTTVKYRYSLSCRERKTRTAHIPHAEISARVLNSQGYRLYKKKKFKEAAKLLARAVVMDPGLEMARGNLASTLLKLGREKDALAVVRNGRASLPPERHLRMLADAELAPLLLHPTIADHRAQTAPKPTQLRLENNQVVDFGVALSADEKKAAVLTVHQSWGTSQVNQWLDFFDLPDGKHVGRYALVSMLDQNENGQIRSERRGAIDRQLDAANAFLEFGGFSTVPASSMHRGTSKNDQPRTSVYFSKEQVGVTAEQNLLRLFHQGKLLERHSAENRLGFITDAWYLPGQKAFVLKTHLDEPEGCDVEVPVAWSAVLTYPHALPPK